MEDWQDLHNVLSSFEERRERELQARRLRESAQTEFRSGCTSVLESFVVPTFTATASLSRRAHECAVTRRIADYDVPSADLTVRPSVPEEKWVRRSRPSMRCVSTEGFVVLWEICPPRRDPLYTQTTHPLEDVTEEWIKKRVLEFVRSVLNEY